MGGTFTLGYFFGILRRHVRVLLSVFLAVAVLGTAGIFALRPVYTASALVLVDPSNKDLLTRGGARGDLSDSARVDSEALIARSGIVLERVVDQLSLAELPEFSRQQGMIERLQLLVGLKQPTTLTADERRDTAIGMLSDRVFVQRQGLTFVLSINAQSFDPQLAAKIADAVSESYLAEQVNRKIAAISTGRDAVASRVSEAQLATEEAERALDSFTAEQVDAIASRTGDSGSAIREQINQITASLSTDTSLIDRINNAILMRNWSGLAADLASGTYIELNQRRQSIQDELLTVDSTSEQVMSLREELNQVEANLLSAARSEVDQIKQDVAARQATANNLREQLSGTIKNADLPASVLTEIFRLQQQAQIARTQYQELLSRYNDLDTQTYLQVADSSLIGAAGVPSSPSFPNTRLFLVALGLLALGLGVGSALLAENVVGGFTSAAQLEAVLHTEVLPALPRQRGRTGSIADAVIDAPLSAFAEAVRRIRLAVDRKFRTASVAKGGRVVMVTSAVSGEGKTSISLALARSFALAGTKCLLIDCDLRRPSLHSHLSLKRDRGLSEFLANPESVGIESVLHRDEKSGVRILLGSERSNAPTDHLVTGDEFAKLIEGARDVFDVIILDTPPVVPVVDSLYIARFADAVVFLTKWASTSQSDAKSAVRSLASEIPPHASILAILNQEVHRSNPRYAGYYSAE